MGTHVLAILPLLRRGYSLDDAAKQRFHPAVSQSLPMNRTTRLLLAGALMLGAIGGGFIAWGIVTESEIYDSVRYVGYAASSERESKLALVVPEFVYQDSSGNPRLDRAVQFRIIGGLAFDHERHVPLGEIQAYLDPLVESGKITYVVISPSTDSAWKDVVAYIEESRKSRVKAVVLNKRAWNNP